MRASGSNGSSRRLSNSDTRRDLPNARPPGRGRCSVVVGCQWGDEGKGKVVDVLAASAHVVARFQGGANAGHTVRAGDQEFILHQIPSGIVHSGKRCLVGNGVVLDLERFFKERAHLEQRGIQVEGRLGISARAHLVLPHHRALDHALERAARTRIGTTGRGIGPAYADKASRQGLRCADLLAASAKALVEGKLRRARSQLSALGADPSEAGDAESALSMALPLGDFVTDVGEEITSALGAGKDVLLEGAQGAVLDVDHGTYPFVTSSNTTAGAASTGAGIGPTAIDWVTGVTKAYATRVGNGPFPTALPPDLEARVRELGGEYGATTGRARRCGWFDGVVAAYASRINGLSGLAVTKLDVLDSLREIRIATSYELDGERTDRFPATCSELERARPVYETHPGWRRSTSSVRAIRDLPRNARAYLDRIEEISNAPITMVSVGSYRNQVIHCS